MNNLEYKRAIVSNYREFKNRLAESSAKNNALSCEEWTPSELSYCQFAGVKVFVEMVVGQMALVSCYVSRYGQSRLNYTIVQLSELSPL